MFNKNITLEHIQQWDKNTIANHLGIEYLEIGEDYLTARMPVDHRTHQPFGLLHGGASVVLAETLGSLSSFLCLTDITKQQAVGLDINANHVRGELKADGYTVNLRLFTSAELRTCGKSKSPMKKENWSASAV